MKPAQFEYYDPPSLQQALELLDAHGEDGKILAGGQSLMPLLNMRLARPKIVVDINRIDHLNYVKATDTGVAIGATARQRVLQSERVIRERVDVLRDAGYFIAHPQIRSRGTICGSLAHADPAAELPALAVALDAELVASGPNTARTIPADAFFLSYFTTALQPNEILTEVRFPAPPQDTAWSVLEVSRRHGDFAIAGIVAGLAVERDRPVINRARLVYFGVGATPMRVKEAEALLIGQAPGEAAFDAAAQAAGQGVDPTGDIHATAEYRRALAATLTRRALRTATKKLMAN
jgi:CO/xanthine dehydrogenase FAD-binding subunit